MPRGEAFKKSFNVIRTGLPDNNSVEYLELVAARCAFKLKLLAVKGDTPDTDPLKNDRTSVYFGYSPIVSAVVLKLYKCDVEVKTLDNNDYGTFYPFNFHYDQYKKYIGYQINWQDIINDADLGEGEYFVRAECTTITGGTYEEDSFTWCLQNYTVPRANGTVRFEWYSWKIHGDRKIDKDIISFPNGTITGEPKSWYNSLRIDGIILSENTNVEIEQDKFFTGQINDIKKEVKPVYDLLVKPHPYFIYQFLTNEVLCSQDMYLTDYNVNCRLKPFVMRNLNFPSIEPNWPAGGLKVDCIIPLEKKFNNTRIRNC